MKNTFFFLNVRLAGDSPPPRKKRYRLALGHKGNIFYNKYLFMSADKHNRIQWQRVGVLLKHNDVDANKNVTENDSCTDKYVNVDNFTTLENA